MSSPIIESNRRSLKEKIIEFMEYHDYPYEKACEMALQWVQDKDSRVASNKVSASKIPIQEAIKRSGKDIAAILWKSLFETQESNDDEIQIIEAPKQKIPSQNVLSKNAQNVPSQNLNVQVQNATNQNNVQKNLNVLVQNSAQKIPSQNKKPFSGLTWLDVVKNMCPEQAFMLGALVNSEKFKNPNSASNRMPVDKPITVDQTEKNRKRKATNDFEIVFENGPKRQNN